MAMPVSTNNTINNEILVYDDNRRRLGIASLHGKIIASIKLLRYADKVCEESCISYEDPSQTEAHLYSCLEGLYAALSEVVEHSQTGMALASQIVSDKAIQPLEKFSVVMRKQNGITV